MMTVAVCSLIGSRRARPVGLVVVVDQHGKSVVVAGQAVEVQGADLFGAAAGVDGQLDGGAHLW